jgi:hypothetical protein
MRQLFRWRRGGLKQNAANEIEMDILDTPMATANPLVAPAAPKVAPVTVPDSLLVPESGPIAESKAEQNNDDTIPPYTLVEYKDSSSLSSVDMNAPFVLVDTKPTGASVPTLNEEDLSAVGLTPANILAFSAMAVISAIKQPESCGVLRQYLFELPPAAPDEDAAEYTIDDILGIQIVFIAMINHLFLLARVQNPSLPEFSKGYQERMEAVVEMLSQEKKSTETLFGISNKTVLEPLYNSLHTTYVGPVGSTAVPVKDAVPEPTKPTVTPPENTTKVGVNSPSGVTFYGLLDMISGTPAAIVENFTTALAMKDKDIPNEVNAASITTSAGFNGMSLPQGSDVSVLNPKPKTVQEQQRVQESANLPVVLADSSKLSASSDPRPNSPIQRSNNEASLTATVHNPQAARMTQIGSIPNNSSMSTSAVHNGGKRRRITRRNAKKIKQ